MIPPAIVLVVTDIILGSFGLLDSFKSWEVSSEPSLSDHKHILFTLKGSVPVHLIRNPGIPVGTPFKKDRMEYWRGVQQ